MDEDGWSEIHLAEISVISKVKRNETPLTRTLLSRRRLRHYRFINSGLSREGRDDKSGNRTWRRDEDGWCDVKGGVDSKKKKKKEKKKAHLFRLGFFFLSVLNATEDNNIDDFKGSVWNENSQSAASDPSEWHAAAILFLDTFLIVASASN